MSFKPSASNNSNASGPREDTSKFPVPRAGSRKARVSLIIDLGTQNREDFEDPITKVMKTQGPKQQVVVFADLVADVVDYGPTIGKAQYRLLLNKAFMGEVQGINFGVVPPKDAKGNTMEGKPYCMHPQNLLTKLAKAVGKTEIINEGHESSLDISLLLGQPFMAQVEVKETEGKKKDADGNSVMYKNVTFRGASEIGEDDDGQKLAIAELTAKPLCITFDNAKKSDIKFIRANLIAKIKLANNYAKSQMKVAIEAHEAENGGGKAAEAAGGDSGDDGDETPAKAVAKPAMPKKPVAPKKPMPPTGDDDFDSDIPFASASMQYDMGTSKARKMARYDY